MTLEERLINARTKQYEQKEGTRMSDKAKSRQMEILRYLMTTAVPLDVAFFEEKFQKSARTIRYDISEIKTMCSNYGVEIRYQTKKGYFIPPSQKMQCSDIFITKKGREKSGLIADSDEERYKKVFLYLFTRKRKVTADQLADHFFISRSTIVRLLARIESFYQNDIRLEAQKAAGYELKGDELVLRRIASDILAEQFKGSYTPEDWYLLIPDPMKQLINLNGLISITNGIKRVNAKHNLWISNIAFLNLLSYCIIRNMRFYQIKPVAKRETGGYTVSGYVMDLMREISFPNEEIPDIEIRYMQCVLEENGIAVNSHRFEEKQLKGALKEMLDLLKGNIESQLGAFNYEELFHELYGHLKSSLGLSIEIRAEENYNVIYEVKENYPAFYRAAVICGRFLEQELSITFSETELCYIAVYLYKHCREKQNQKKNVLIICATGKGLSNLLSIRIERVFPMLNVVGQASPYQVIHHNHRKDIDFIISTTPLPVSQIPVVKISRILNTEDIKRIQAFIDYGELIDEIPLKQKDDASFCAKADPFALSENQPEYTNKELICATNTLSKLILTLLEYTSKLPERYKLSQDAQLGLIIHMSMAIPRWYESRTGLAASEDYSAEYAKIQKNHTQIFEIMEKFFDLVESSLHVSISIEEKIAFFLYIINEEEKEP